MQFLKKFWQELRKSDSADADADAVAAAGQDVEGHSDIGPDERLGRFVFHEKDVSRGSGLPKQKVFLPEKHPETGVFETSVCRMDTVDDGRSWPLADRLRHPLQVVARADFFAKHVTEVGLSTKAAPEPMYDYPEHAVVVDWDIEKEKQKAVAALLVFYSRIVER